jgi:hypothetical protein
MLKHSLNLLLFASMTAGLAWAAENPFIGEWKLDSSKSRMPDEMKVESKGGNTYAFDFGGGTETIVADGSDQPGAYGGTTLSVKAEGPYTWIVERKKDGRLLLRGTWKLSQDGNTLADYYREFEADGSTVVSMDYIYQRSGAGSGFAADWKSIKETMNSPFLLEVKAYQGGGLTFILPAEHSTRNAMLDGKDYPNPGGRSLCSIRQVDEHTLEMKDKAGEKVMDTQEITLSADGKVLTMTMNAPGRSESDVLVFDRE